MIMYLVKCKYCDEEIDLWEISMHLEQCPKREEWEKEHEEDAEIA